MVTAATHDRIRTQFLARCTARQNSERGNHGTALYGGPCRVRVERCIQCVIDQAVEDLEGVSQVGAEEIGEETT